MKKEKSDRKIRLDGRIASLVFCIAGIMMIVNPGFFAGLVCFIAGVGILVYGVVRIVNFNAVSADARTPFDTVRFIFGIVCAAAGLLLIFRYKSVIGILNFFVGAFILIDSVTRILRAASSKSVSQALRWTVVGVSAVSAVLALVLMINPFKGTELLFIFIGVTLAVNGAIGLFSGKTE